MRVGSNLRGKEKEQRNMLLSNVRILTRGDDAATVRFSWPAFRLACMCPLRVVAVPAFGIFLHACVLVLTIQVPK